MSPERHVIARAMLLYGHCFVLRHERAGPAVKRAKERKAVRFATALLLGALALAGATTAALVGSGNPTGQWATPSAVRAFDPVAEA
jgi:hypothetical protein